MQKIIIEQLQVPALIGVYDFERTQNTCLLVSLELDVDITAASLSDNLDDTVDYGNVAEVVKQVASQTSFQLLEALGRTLCQAVLEHFAVSQVTIKIEKPDILPDAKTVAVIMCLNRHGMVALPSS